MEAITETRFERLYAFIIDKLARQLDPGYTYHNVKHTEAVVEAAKYLSAKEKLSIPDQVIVMTAALFHDAGFLRDYEEHEKASCDIARELLPQYNYLPEEIEKICSLIMATRLPQAPVNLMEKVICDADLYFLGSDNYFSIAEDLFLEYKKQGIVKTRKEWIKKQVRFLADHQFFTETAKSEGTAKKKQHLRELKSSLSIHPHDHKKKKWVTTFKDLFLIVLGVLSAGFALKGFLVPNHFFDGGVTGISLLVHEVYHLHLGYVIVLANLPLVIISYFFINRKFALKTIASVILLGIALLYIPYPIITSDKLLISIFGGVFLGIGVGLTMRAGCALDGVEVLALFTFKRTPFTITEIILAINIIIFSIAALGFGLETALYSVLTYFTATKIVDYVVEGIEAFTGVTIISSKSDIIKRRLVNEMGKAITVYKGERGFLPDNFEVSSECDIIFTVTTRLELRRLKNLVMESDPKAFVFASTIREAAGGILSRKQEH